MTVGALSGLPPAVQLILYALIGVGIAAGVVVSYFKAAGKEKASGEGMVLAGDPRTVQALTNAVERLAPSLDRLDHTNRRLEDAARDLREEMGKFRGALAQAALQPRDEELNRLLAEVVRLLDRRD